MSDFEQCSTRLQLDLIILLVNIFAPPAERQQSFSNVELPVVRRGQLFNFIKVGKVKFGSYVNWRQFSQKVFDHFFSILA